MGVVTGAPEALILPPSTCPGKVGAVVPGESQKAEERFQRPPCTEAWHLGQKHLLECVRAEGGREATDAARTERGHRGKWGKNVEQSLSEGEEAGLAPGGAASWRGHAALRLIQLSPGLGSPGDV